VEAPNEPDRGDAQHDDGSWVELFPFVLFGVVFLATVIVIIFGGT
jgi:hypothetical protein